MVELKAGGFGAAELKVGGFSAAELVAGGFGAELKAAGFGAAELKASGFGAAEVKAGGFGAAELFAAGYTTLAEYKGLGFKIGQLCSTGRPDGKPFSSREVAPSHCGLADEPYTSDLSRWASDWASGTF